MALDLVPLSPLERGQLHVMRVRAIVLAIVLVAAAAIGEIAARDLLPFPGLLIAPAALLAIWIALLAPQRRWRHWGHAFTGRELHVASGWLFRVHTIVPVVRVQHIDVAQGPIERAFGVARLVLHTAGTESNVVVLPGITRAAAEEIRDSIRRVIGSAE